MGVAASDVSYMRTRTLFALEGALRLKVVCSEWYSISLNSCCACVLVMNAAISMLRSVFVIVIVWMEKCECVGGKVAVCLWRVYGGFS